MTVKEDGSISFEDGTVALGDVTLASIINPMLSQAGLTFENIGVLLPILWDNLNVSQIYDLVVDMAGLPLPKSSDMGSLELTTANLSVTIRTDKDLKLTYFSANADLEGGYSVTDSYSDTVSKYAADIKASAKGTFGYEAIAA